ncbi:MAG TPA: hypothetical protein VG940_08325 [Gemmatimonadales bacterium]|nr:hypothetical protein [Gemmatimonadales bacterium]
MPATAARRALTALTLLAALARPAQAQERGWDLLLSSGRLTPTGAQRSQIEAGNSSALQFWYHTSPTLALTGTLGWTRSRDLVAPGSPKLDLIDYSIGAEMQRATPMRSGRFSLRPFVGGGVGGRRADLRGVTGDATHALATYAGAGIEFGYRRVGLRVEGRDELVGITSKARNDVAILVGLRLLPR